MRYDPQTVQNQTDSIGRATFYNIAPQTGIRPTAREIRWLRHIKRHGPQSSLYLHALTSDTHVCRDTSLRQLQKLRAAGYLHLPTQQRATERAEFKPYIYDLTRQAERCLFDLGFNEPTVRPTGHWWHGNAVSSVTSSIDIAAKKHGIGYIPAHDILAINNATLAMPIKHSKLIPDQLFALNYGGRYRTFALEVDRGTEPKTSPTGRKSYVRSIRQYRQVIENSIQRSHYGIKSNLLVMWVFTSASNEARFLNLVAEYAGEAKSVILTQNIALFQNGPGATSIMTHLLTNPWQRADGATVSIAC